jgi:hypothetical protein
LSGRFIGAVGLAAFPLKIHEVQKVTSRPRIAQRTVMRLEFDPVKLAQSPEAVRLVSGVAPTHAGDGAQLRKPEAAIESFVLMAYEAVSASALFQPPPRRTSLANRCPPDCEWPRLKFVDL